MPNIGQIKKSRFITRADVKMPQLFTITSCSEVNVAQEGAPEELRWALNFHETEKPFVLNSTNAQIIAKFIGSEETDDWAGHKVVLFDDPNISFGGKLVGGVRARQPKAATASNPPPRPPAGRPAPVSPPPAEAPGDEDVPF